jgi:nucleoside transporter
MTPQAPLPFVRARLSAMMFLEFFIWGAWLPLIFGYLPSLGFSSAEQGWITSAFAMASITAMFFSTQFADRHFAAERFCAFSNLVGGLSILALYWVHDFWPFFVLMLVHSLFYVPTISITNSIAFAALKDAQREFGKVRLWGTIGWIAASWPFVFLLAGKTGAALHSALTAIFIVAAVASFVLALFSLTLPATPPATMASDASAPLKAIRLLAAPPMLVLFVVTLIDALVHQCYFQWTSPFLQAAGLAENWIMPAMSIGQVAEIASMAVLGLVLSRLGWRATMTLGILAHALRFFVFAIGDPLWLMVSINVVHGICYAFFFAAVYIFVDECCPRDARASAQGLFNLVILGIGPFAGSLLWGSLGDVLRTPNGAVIFSRLFLAPAVLGLVAALLLVVGFRPRDRAEIALS